MLKLYKIRDGEKRYWETWENDDNSHVVHWGVLGTRGDSKTVESSLLKSAESQIQKEIEAVVADGFRPIDSDRLYTLIIEYKVAGMGTADDFEKRHRLESRIHETLGWTGLGAGDGGSIGSGTMEVFTIVVDFELAKKVIEADLAGTEFANYTRIYDEDTWLTTGSRRRKDVVKIKLKQRYRVRDQKPPDDKIDFLRYIIPRYDEVTLFAMSFTCILLIIDSFFKPSWGFLNNESRDDEIRLLTIILFSLAGLVPSMYHAFITRPKTSFEKTFMLLFAVSLNAFCGISLGFSSLKQTNGWLAIFPIINIASAAVLIVLMKADVLDENSIRDENASRTQIALATAAIIILFIVCDRMLHIGRIQTLSICVAYATNLSRAVESIFWRPQPTPTAKQP